MSADPRFDSERVESSGSASAIYFDSGGHRLFGWLQSPPSGWMRNTGLVICKPFGYEAICAHRGLRAFSEAAVALGVPTLRVDYLGTGDSPEIDSEADQLKVWTADVVAAVSELCSRTGVESVCILGVRLGALLATLAANECPAVTSLILISPLVSGRRYLRELRTSRLAAAMATAQSSAEPSGAQPECAIAEAASGSMEASGFLFSKATLESLAEVDLVKQAAPSIFAALVIDGKSLPVANAYAQRLTGCGIRTQYDLLPGLIEMIMTAPQFTSIPQEMISAMQDWLLLQSLRNTAAPSTGEPRSPKVPAVPTSSVMTLLGIGPAPHAPLIERPVFFGTTAVLFGIVTEPRERDGRGRAVILLNAGADHHVGANGMHVDLARRWAGGGYVALRMDLAGLGDSATRPGEADNEVFPAGGMDDIRAAIDLLRARYGSTEITLFGLCSGAYHALRAAAAELPVSRILMVNPQNYFWKKGMDLNGLQLAEVVRNPGVYRRRIVSAEAWKRLLTGRVNLWRIVKISFLRPVLALESTLRDAARRLHIRLPHDLGSELAEIAARGVKIVFVFARGEPGIELLHVEGGSVVNQLGERCRIHVIDGADHVFSQHRPRTVLRKLLSDELFAAD